MLLHLILHSPNMLCIADLCRYQSDFFLSSLRLLWQGRRSRTILYCARLKTGFAHYLKRQGKLQQDNSNNSRKQRLLVDAWGGLLLIQSVELLNVFKLFKSAYVVAICLDSFWLGLITTIFFPLLYSGIWWNWSLRLHQALGEWETVRGNLCCFLFPRTSTKTMRRPQSCAQTRWLWERWSWSLTVVNFKASVGELAAFQMLLDSSSPMVRDCGSYSPSTSGRPEVSHSSIYSTRQREYQGS